jgi:hypothetical protein
MAGKPILPAEFATWLRPIVALAMFEANFHSTASAIATGLVTGSIGAAAETLTFEGATVHRGRIPAGLWNNWRSDNDALFWVTGDFCRVVAPSLGEICIDHRVEAFGVRFDPTGVESLLGIRRDLSAGNRARRSVGRRAGTNGEPIARVVKRLVPLPSARLASYKVETLAAELAEEYRALGLRPPHLDNARRDARGILRALRERRDT